MPVGLSHGVRKEGGAGKTVPKTVGASTVEAPEATTADVGAIRAAGPSQADEPVGALESSYPARGEGLPIPDKSSLVRVRDYIPDILVDLKYSTEDNFTGSIFAVWHYRKAKAGPGHTESPGDDAENMGCLPPGFRPILPVGSLPQLYLCCKPE